MTTLTFAQLSELEDAIGNITGYLSDNSCGDPDCCGGPFYDKDQYDEGLKMLESFGLRFDPSTVPLA
jgi:hypothetical protein